MAKTEVEKIRETLTLLESTHSSGPLDEIIQPGALGRVAQRAATKVAGVVSTRHASRSEVLMTTKQMMQAWTRYMGSQNIRFDSCTWQDVANFLHSNLVARLIIAREYYAKPIDPETLQQILNSRTVVNGMNKNVSARVSDRGFEHLIMDEIAPPAKTVIEPTRAVQNNLNLFVGGDPEAGDPESPSATAKESQKRWQLRAKRAEMLLWAVFEGASVHEYDLAFATSVRQTQKPQSEKPQAQPAEPISQPSAGSVAPAAPTAEPDAVQAFQSITPDQIVAIKSMLGI
jgi:hypothetical protein